MQTNMIRAAFIPPFVAVLMSLGACGEGRTYSSGFNPAIDCEKLRQLCIIEDKDGCAKAKFDEEEARRTVLKYRAFCPITENET